MKHFERIPQVFSLKTAMTMEGLPNHTYLTSFARFILLRSVVVLFLSRINSGSIFVASDEFDALSNYDG